MFRASCQVLYNIGVLQCSLEPKESAALVGLGRARRG